MNNNILNDFQASQYLNLSRSWLRQSRMRGTGPKFLKLGRAVRYRLEDLEAWLLQHQRQNTIQVGKEA